MHVHNIQHKDVHLKFSRLRCVPCLQGPDKSVDEYSGPTVQGRVRDRSKETSDTWSNESSSSLILWVGKTEKNIKLIYDKVVMDKVC